MGRVLGDLNALPVETRSVPCSVEGHGTLCGCSIRAFCIRRYCVGKRYGDRVVAIGRWILQSGPELGCSDLMVLRAVTGYE